MKTKLHFQLRQLLTVTLFGLIHFLSSSQCLSSPVNLNQRVSASHAIIEGEVISQNSYWDVSMNNIYTVNAIRPYKAFKGQLQNNEIVKVVTLGGTVDLEKIEFSGALQLNVGSKGVFILKNAIVNIPNQNNLYNLVEDGQGFIKYDEYNQTASDNSRLINSIENELYRRLERLTGNSVNLMRNESIFQNTTPNIQQRALGITGISPTTVNGGVSDIITITGTDFGTTQGTINFRDSNSGGSSWISAFDSDIISWTNTSIQVKVISRASTGSVQVVTDAGTSVQSTQTITVNWAHSNATYNPGSGNTYYEVNLRAKDANGGYIFQYGPLFDADTDATAAFESLVETWNCATSVNFEIGSPITSTAIASDNVNSVLWKTGTEIVAAGGSSSTLAFVRSYYSGCISGGVVSWYVKELDVVCNSDRSWYYGTGTPSSSQYDFETVVLHELGHGHQLGHVGQSSDVMYYALAAGQQKRDISTQTLNGGDYVFNKSSTTSVCSQPYMTAYSGALCCNDPIVTNNPANQSGCASEDYTFSVAGDYENSYQWQVQTGSTGSWSNISNGTNYSGATTASLTVNDAPFSFDDNNYRCILSNACVTTATSSSATLTVSENPSASVTITNATCDGSTNGKLTFTFSDNASRSNIEFSVNGGASYPYNFLDNAGSGETSSLTDGTYNVWVRWGDNTCPVDLGNYTVSTDADNIDPTAICQNITVALDADGNATISASDVDDGSSDSCGNVTLSLNKTAFTCSDLGSNSVTLTVTDENSNTATCNATVTVQDNLDPTVSALSTFTLDLDNNGEASLAVSDIDTGSTDNCGIASSTLSNTNFNGTDIGTSTQTLTIEDTSGNTVNHNFSLIVRDITVPVITLNGNASVTIELGSTYTDLGATATDNVDGDLSSSIVTTNNVNSASVGTYAVNYNVADASGNDAVQVTRTVNVVDTTLPVISLTGANPQTIELGDGYTELGATTDDGSTVIIDSSEFMDAVGSYTIYYDATDASGNDAVQVTRTVNVVSTLSIDETTLNEVYIYPNPTSSIIHIKHIDTIDKIEILNIAGQVITQQESKFDQVNLSRFEAGIYLLRVSDGENNRIFKVMKK